MENENVTTVDIAVACSAHQIPDWWNAVMGMILYTDRLENVRIEHIRTVSSALPDQNKNSTIGNQKRRWSLTDANRNKIVNHGFIDEGSDWIFWMDDDTVPPVDAIERLLNQREAFVAGVYFLPSEPYNPIAYKRHKDNGLYAPVYGYPKGALIEVDSVGMGCTLIHRSVYERIKEEFMVFERPNGSIYPVHKSNVKKPLVKKIKDPGKEPYVKYGEYREQVIPQQDEDGRNFPFYLLEHGRTEDHHFCELAAKVGIKPKLDTTITCKHYKHQPTIEDAYLNEIEKAEGILQ